MKLNFCELVFVALQFGTYNENFKLTSKLPDELPAQNVVY
jgi:hypothetical protein